MDQLVNQTDALGNTTTYRYDLVGNVLEVIDPLGRVTKTTYDALDRAVSVVDPLGFVGTRTYDALGQLLSERDPLGNSTAFQYDVLGNEVATIDALGNITTSFYNAASQLVKVVDANGNETSFEYDEAGREVLMLAPDGGSYGKQYDLNGNLVAETDPIGRTTTYEYDAENQLIRRVDPAGGVATFLRDGRGSVTESTDAEGNTTKYTYDVLGRKESESDPLNRRVSYSYDAISNITSIRSPGGNVTQYVYDGLSRKTAEVNALGQSFKTEFDAVGNVTAVVDPAGNLRTYTYDKNDRLVSETNAVGAVTKYTYDAAGRRTSIVDSNDYTTRFEFDALGRVTKRTHPDDTTFGFVYDAVGNQIQRINELGDIWSSEFDAVGRIVAQSDPLGNRAVAEFDLAGQRVSETDALGNKFGFVYDALGNQVEQLYPAAGDGLSEAKVVTTRDKLGRPISLTNRLGATESYEYDAAGQQIATTDAIGLETSFEFDLEGNLTKSVLPTGQTITYEFDKLNRPVKTIDPSGSASSTVYDVAGNIISATDQLGRTTFYEYDAETRQTKIMAADGTTVQRTFDGVGNLLTETDSQGRTVTFAYDNRNRMVTTTQSDGSKTEQIYNAASHLTSVIDASGNTMTYEYDQVGREKAVVDALGGRTELVYDAIGRLIERTEPRGQKVTFALDNWGRVVEENWLNGGESFRTILSSYDANDRLLSIDDGESSLSFKYDARSQVSNSTQSYDGPLGSFNAAVNFNYDAAGRPNGNTYLVDGQIVHDTVQTYTPAGNTDSLEFRIPGILSAKAQYAWDAAYQLIAINRSVVLQGGGSSPAVVDTDRVADVLGRPLLISHSINSATDIFDRVVEQSFVYDTANRLIRSTDAFGVHDYAYDEIGQLAKVTHENESLPVQNYVFDAAGNPEEFDGRNVTVGSGNRLMNDGEYSYSYDEAGNLTRRVSLTDGSATDYLWDIRDRLIEVRQSDGEGNVIRTVRYAYDPANRRIAEMITEEGDETSRFFVYDKEDIAVQLADTDGPSGVANATVAKQFFHGVGSDQILATFDANAVNVAEPTDDEILSALHWYLTDHLGSVRDVVDGHGRTLDSILYDAFGNMLVRTDASVDLPYGFTGRELDVATGLYYYRARYYDPAVGRFLTPDPSGLAAGDTNLYRYVGNNPTSLVDPSGLEAQHPMSGLLDDVANGLKSFRQWSGIERVTDRFVTGALNLVGLGDNATATQVAFQVTGLVSGTLSGRHLENIIRFGSGLAEGAEEAFFDASSIGFDIYNRYHGIQSSDSNLFKAIDTVNSPLDAAFLGISLIVAPFFSFVDFGNKVLSGDPKAAGKSTFTTLPQVAGVSNFFPGRRTRVPNYARIGKEFFGQPVGSGLRTLLDSPASFGGILSVARQTVLRRRIAKAALAEGRLVRNRAEFVDELNKLGRFEKYYVASGRNDRAARNSPYYGKSAEEVLGTVKGVHPSVKQALQDKNSPFGQQLRYVLEKMHNSPGIYNRTLDLLAKKPNTKFGRKVDDFDELGLVTRSDLFYVKQLSRKYPDHTVGLFGSNGSSLGSLVNQHVLVEALKDGRLSIKTLRKLHPEVDLEALLKGRLLANPTKIGGQFGSALDYDLAISNGKNFRGLKPFREVFDSAEEAAIKGIFPKGSETDLNYGFFENESLTGSSFSNRGRVLFQNGKLLKRQDSHLYGVDGRVVRDFPELFAEARLGQSTQLFNKLDWDRVRPTLPVYATLFAYEVSAGWVGVSDVLGGAAGLNNKTGDGNYIYQLRKAGGYANNFYGEKSAGLFQIGELESTLSVATHSPVGSLQNSDLPNIAETSFQFAINHATASTPNLKPSAGLVPVAVNAILDSAWSAWSVSTADAGFERIDIKFEDLPGMQIAEARPAANSSTPQIIIDTDGAGLGWFVDATPGTDDEFTADSMATTRFDLLTVLTHEIGHLLGFGASFKTFDSLVQSAGGKAYVTSGPTRWYLNESHTELDPMLHSDAVMAETIAPGKRRRPSAQEIRLISSLAGSLYDTPAGLHQHGDGVANIGFVTLANAHTLAIQTNGIAVALRNSRFTEGDSFWVTEGAVAFAERSATLSETTSVVTDLSQTFRLPVEARSLSFVVDAIGLGQNAGSNAHDAFEVALLDALSTTSLVDAMQGLDGSDALLSIQADGRVFFAPEVVIQGVTSGEVIDLSQPIVVTIDFANVEAETIATLYFDLIGFGDDLSEVTVSNLMVETTRNWHNRDFPSDVDGDGQVTPLDVLLPINELNSRKILRDGSNALPEINDLVGPPPYYDVNDDGLLTPIDVLLVVNYINAAGEGEVSSLSNTTHAIDVINELNQVSIDDRSENQRFTADIHARDMAFETESYDELGGMCSIEEPDAWGEYDAFVEQIASKQQKEVAGWLWYTGEWDD